MNKGVWSNGKRKITGRWVYRWASDSFFIELNSKDPVTGLQRSFTTKNDTPEWRNWKLLKEELKTS